MDVSARPSQDAILTATRDLLVREGYGSLTMRKIARRVGCSVGSLYLHFEGKDALLYALLDTGYGRLQEAMDAVSTEVPAAAADRLRHLIRAYLDFGLANPEYYEILFMIHPKEMARFPDALYARTQALLEPVEGAIQAYAEEIGAPLADSRLAVVALWSAVHGLLSLLLAGRLTRLSLKVDHEQLIDLAVEQALRGLSACLDAAVLSSH